MEDETALTAFFGLANIMVLFAFYVLPAAVIIAGIVILKWKPAWKKAGVVLLVAGALMLAFLGGNHLRNYLLGV